MKSIGKRILNVSLGALTIAIMLMTTISIVSVSRLSNKDSEELMTQVCDKETVRVNDELQLIENSVSTIVNFVEDKENECSSENELLSDEFSNKIMDMTYSIANRTSGAMSVYFRYNPELTGNGTQGFFLTRESDEESFYSIEPTDILQYDQSDTEHVGWFYEPKKRHEAIWMAPYYNRNLNVFMISYIVPYYTKSGDFLGVIGMDVDFDKIVRLISDVTLYKTGKVYLADLSTYYLYSLDDNGIVITEELARDQYNRITTINSQNSVQSIQDNKGRLYYSCIEELSNGMRLLLYVPSDEINAYRNQLSIVFLVIMIGALLISFIIIIKITNKIVSPLKRLTTITEEYSRGKWDNTFISNTNDEIQKLSESISMMADATKSSLEEIHDAAVKEREAREEADRANTAKGQFLANMSHEIRTPINAILGMDTMILRETGEATIKEYAMNIQNASTTLLSLINEILDFSKISAGKMEIVPDNYDFALLINDVMNMITFKAGAKNLDVVLDIDESLPSGLYGDETRIKQVIINIMNNAVKYTEKGCVTLIIKGVIQDDTVILDFRVKDTGIGIKEEDLGKIFESFVRVDQSRNRNVEGTGLGMNITVELLSLMDSKLDVTSVYGEGSEFFFTLKQKIVDMTPVGDFKQKMQNKADSFSYKELFTAPDADILVVDDSDINRLVFRQLLKKTKVKIDEANSGMKALELLFKKHYDIIFLDHMMPEMDGVETLKRIKENHGHPNTDTPVIVLTANAINGAQKEYIDAGFTDYLAKPIIPETLEKMIASYLPDPKKILSGSVEEEKSDNSDDGDVFELPPTEGIDWDYAKLHISDNEMLLETIRSFIRSVDSEADKLKEMYNDIINGADGDAIDQFRIKVHAMKSTATLLGFVPVAGMAATLEYAAREGNKAVIADMTPHFLDSWRGYKDKLLFAKEEDNDKKSIDDKEIIVENIQRLKDAMWDFDVHGADEALSILNEYSYSSEMESILDKISVAVNDLNTDEAMGLCDELSEKIKEI